MFSSGSLLESLEGEVNKNSLIASKQTHRVTNRYSLNPRAAKKEGGDTLNLSQGLVNNL